MDSLTDLYNQALLPMDEQLEKQAGEMLKQAEEEDAAGRIMARGFADELNKLAGPWGGPSGPGGAGGNVDAGPSTGSLLGKGRTLRAPKVPNIGQGKGQFGKGKTVAPSGQIQPKKPPTPPSMGQ